MQTLTFVRPITEDREDSMLITKDFVIGLARTDREKKEEEDYAIALNLPLAMASLRPTFTCTSCGKARSARRLYPKHVAQHGNSIQFSCLICTNSSGLVTQQANT